MTPFHLDTDFLITAISEAGPERRRLLELNASAAPIHTSAVAWYEFARGPRTPEQLAVARFFIDDVVPFADDLASRAADVFRKLGSPRRRANDIAIGVTAASANATLLTSNSRDFAGIPQLTVERPA